MQKKALVVIDIQNDITKHYKEIIGHINQAIDWAAEHEIHVVYIRHYNLSAGTRTFKPDTVGAELVPEMKIVSDNIFIKSKGNALTSEAFAGGQQQSRFLFHGEASFDVTCVNISGDGLDGTDVCGRACCVAAVSGLPIGRYAVLTGRTAWMFRRRLAYGRVMPLRQKLLRGGRSVCQIVKSISLCS